MAEGRLPELRFRLLLWDYKRAAVPPQERLQKMKAKPKPARAARPSAACVDGGAVVAMRVSVIRAAYTAIAAGEGTRVPSCALCGALSLARYTYFYTKIRFSTPAL